MLVPVSSTTVGERNETVDCVNVISHCSARCSTRRSDDEFLSQRRRVAPGIDGGLKLRLRKTPLSFVYGPAIESPEAESTTIHD